MMVARAAMMRSLLLALLLVPAHASGATAGALLSPVQATVMRRLATRAAAASNAATPAVLAAFDDAEFRRMLKAALPPGTTTLDPAVPSSELLRRYRAEVTVAEAVHSFRASPLTTQMSLDEAMHATGAPNMWELQVAAAARGQRQGAEQVADHAGFGGMNACEEGLFGFPTFTGSRLDDPGWAAKVWPANEAEASARPLYSALNLRKVDGGNDIFGPVGVVWRQKTMAAERTILTPVDTGCYEYLCNSSWFGQLCSNFSSSATLCNHAWTGRECKWDSASSSCTVDIQLRAANCSQWQEPVLDSFAGTPSHHDHLILPSAHWWNGSTLPLTPTPWRENLVGMMTRMFRRWPSTVNQSGGCWSALDFTPATSIENFWEAEVLSPRYGPGANRSEGDVKMILGLFDRFYGTAGADLLRQWCNAKGWALVWALGPGWPATDVCGDAPINPSNQRLLDPEAMGTAASNLSLPIAKAKRAAAAAWLKLNSTHRPTGDYEAVTEVWRELRDEIPESFRLEPLYGLSCADIDCIGIVEGSGDCVCYAAAEESE